MMAALLGTSVGAQAVTGINTPSPIIAGGTFAGVGGQNGGDSTTIGDTPSDGLPGNPGLVETYTTQNIVSSPTTKSGLIVTSSGGIGEEGGSGGDYHAGRAGGDGGTGGAVTLTTLAGSSLTITGTGLMGSRLAAKVVAVAVHPTQVQMPGAVERAVVAAP